MYRLLIGILFLLIVLPGKGQVSLTADSTDLLIGDQTGVELRIRLSQGGQWINRDVSIPDSIDAIRILDENEPEMQGGELVRRWKIGVYDTGYVVVPPLPIVISDAGRMDTMYSNSLPFAVAGVIDSTNQIAPIKDIFTEPRKLVDYLPYFTVIGVIVLLGLALWFLYAWRKRKSRISLEIPVVHVPAHTVAMDKLDALEKEKLWQQGYIKEYHSELNYIIREYLQRRYKISALESVTGEILGMLAPLHLESGLLSDLRAMLEAEDLIKFAKAEPPVEVHARYMELARSLVLKTRRSEIPEDKKEGNDV